MVVDAMPSHPESLTSSLGPAITTNKAHISHEIGTFLLSVQVIFHR